MASIRRRGKRWQVQVRVLQAAMAKALLIPKAGIKIILKGKGALSFVCGNPN